MASPETLASVSDLAEFIDETIATGSGDEKRARWCLRLASSLVREETGRTWLDDTGHVADDVPEAAVTVTVYCAARVYDNPQALTTSNIDDRDEGFKVQEAGAYLTASERRMLSRIGASASGGGMWSVTTQRDAPPATTGLVPTGTPDVEFPWY